MNSTDHTESSGESEQKRNAYSAYRKDLQERHRVSGLQGLRIPHCTKNELRCTVPPLMVGSGSFYSLRKTTYSLGEKIEKCLIDVDLKPSRGGSEKNIFFVLLPNGHWLKGG